MGGSMEIYNMMTFPQPPEQVRAVTHVAERRKSHLRSAFKAVGSVVLDVVDACADDPNATESLRRSKTRVARIGAATTFAGAGVAIALLQGPAIDTGGESTDATPACVTVVAQFGDSPWTIARRANPDGEIRPQVDAIVAELDGRTLQPGDEVEVC